MSRHTNFRISAPAKHVVQRTVAVLGHAQRHGAELNCTDSDREAIPALYLRRLHLQATLLRSEKESHTEGNDAIREAVTKRGLQVATQSHSTASKPAGAGPGHLLCSKMVGVRHGCSDRLVKPTMLRGLGTVSMYARLHACPTVESSRKWSSLVGDCAGVYESAVPGSHIQYAERSGDGSLSRTHSLRVS